jgi:hypothetical protein
MNIFLKNIIKKYLDFNEYLQQINVKDFDQFSRQELIEFTKILRQHTHLRYITSDIDKIIANKKLEEYPELLGVHNYPEIKEIDFLSEEDKVNLDKSLCSLGYSSYIYKGSTLWRNVSNTWSEDVQDKIFKFLLEKGIVERHYKIHPCCFDKVISQVVVNNFMTFFNLHDENGIIPKEKYFENEEFIYSMMNESEGCCDDCDNDYEITKDMIEEAINNTWQHLYKVVKTRDKSLDDK